MPASRDQLMETPIGRLDGCALALRCYDGCTRTAFVSMPLLAARHGQRLQLRHIIGRLRCRGCHRPPAAVTILDHVIDEEIPTWRVELLP
jgi:hypothetical protein